MFNAKKEVNNIVKFIRKYYKNNNLDGVVIGISGGKDSAVVAALFTKALGKENVIGITMPCHSKKQDKNDAEIISSYFGFELYDFDLAKVFDAFKKIFLKSIEYQSDNSDINLKPRLRMSTLYYFASTVSEINKKTYIVAGTGNKCEIYIGYFTKHGDGASDINVLANYTVSEVIKLGEYLHVPKEILYKIPSDGLGKLSDEEKLGVTYNEIEKHIEGKKTKNIIKIKEMFERNSHKKETVIYEREGYND